MQVFVSEQQPAECVAREPEQLDAARVSVTVVVLCVFLSSCPDVECL